MWPLPVVYCSFFLFFILYIEVTVIQELVYVHIPYTNPIYFSQITYSLN